jgi:Ca2+-binding EF-hand superfamily protein
VRDERLLMVLPVLLISAAAAAQSPQSAPPVSPSSGEHRVFGERAGRPFMSPMGEPVFGRMPGDDGLVAWFDLADRNHDGALTVDEMTADAQRFFETLDTNHDGEIDPDEITRYENVIAPEVRGGPLPPPATLASAGGQQGGRTGDRSGARHGGGRGHRGGGGEGYGGGFDGGGDDEARAGRYGLLQIPEPVVSADADFNRGVSVQEFRNAAVQRFQLLDVNHSGRLVLSELQSIREAAASAARRPPPTKSSPDDVGSPPGDQPM